MAINVCAEEKEIINPPSSVLNVTENGNYSLRGYDIANVNVSGGGSSDFSTAQVTINKTKSGAASFYGATIMTDSGYSGADELSSGLLMTFGSKETVTIILYKGAAEIMPSQAGTISNVVGNAVLDNGVLIVKGDCEFTLVDTT